MLSALVKCLGAVGIEKYALKECVSMSIPMWGGKAEA